MPGVSSPGTGAVRDHADADNRDGGKQATSSSMPTVARNQEPAFLAQTGRLSPAAPDLSVAGSAMPRMVAGSVHWRAALQALDSGKSLAHTGTTALSLAADPDDAIASAASPWSRRSDCTGAPAPPVLRPRQGTPGGEHTVDTAAEYL